MNHPFPANLPLLRKIYAGRFSAVLFLVPFERLPDEDVITVYRGSYTHAAYLTDAAAALAATDCDYFMVVHDDVLLNPGIDEATFLDLFQLGPDDGFIPRIGPLHPELQQWLWAAGFVPKLAYPKSMLFGGGVEPANLRKYFPDPAVLRTRMAHLGFAGTEQVRIDPAAVTPDEMPGASRLLLHGLSASLLDGTPAQERIEAASTGAFRQLVEAMREDAAARGKLAAGDRIALPLPLATSGYVTDFYILPRSGLADFCHYVGVAAAANLFVEIMAPSLLFACCERVRTSEPLGLDFGGFDETRHLHWLREPKAVAIHPFKLSVFKSEAAQDHLIDILHLVRDGGTIPPSSPLARTTFGRWHGGFLGHAEGWHDGEDWGVWAAASEAVIPVAMPRAGAARVILTAPLGGPVLRFTGRLETGDGGTTVLDMHAGQPPIETILNGVVPEADGVARIRLVSDRLVRPCDIDPASPDRRGLGFGLIRIEPLV